MLRYCQSNYSPLWPGLRFDTHWHINDSISRWFSRWTGKSFAPGNVSIFNVHPAESNPWVGVVVRPWHLTYPIVNPNHDHNNNRNTNQPNWTMTNCWAIRKQIREPELNRIGLVFDLVYIYAFHWYKYMVVDLDLDTSFTSYPEIFTCVLSPSCFASNLITAN